MNVNHKYILLFASFLLLISFAAMAMPPGPPPMGMGPPCWPPPCSVPIDGGIGFLVVAGVAYAGKKLYKRSKKSPE